MFDKNILQRGITLIVFIIILTLPIITDYFILTDPTKAALAKEDKQQYVTHHPAGYGVSEVVNVVDSEVRSGEKVTLVTQGTFGLFPYAFTLKYWDQPSVTILPRWPLTELDNEIYEKARQSKIIIVFKEHNEIPQNLPLTLIQKAPKPGGFAPILITELDSTSRSDFDE